MKQFNLKTGKITWAVLFFIALTMIGAASVARAEVKPFVDCVEREIVNGAATGNYIAYFGYVNDSTGFVIFPPNGANNYFSPVASTVSNQVQVFDAGVHPRATSITVPIGTTETWFLDASSVSVSFNANNLCGADGANSRLTTFQGRLSDNNQAANGIYDLQIQMYNALTGGLVRTSAMTFENVPVANGIFTVQLDLGANAIPFDNLKLNPAITSAENGFFEIAVRAGTSTGAYTTLTPRQPITAVPLAMRANTANNAFRAANADNAINAERLGGSAASQFVQTNDARLTDARTPTAGSANYIQNTTTQQATSNFNISGTGAANVFDATTQFNLGGTRILSRGGNSNLFAGVDAGGLNTGSSNSFFGTQTGQSNTTGGGNSFFGAYSGVSNTTGNNNSFFGRSAGDGNTTGRSNSFFGSSAGYSSTTGNFNAFLAVGAGYSNTSGSNNAFVGFNSGTLNTSGSNNAFVGQNTGRTNTTGGNNALLGSNADVGANNLIYATAVGANALVNTNDTIVLGKTAGTYDNAARPADTVQIPGNLIVSGTISGNVSSGCRAGFTAVANGRLCISEMQTANTFYNAAQLCTNMNARLGNSADVALSFTLSGFNYFAGSPGGEPTPKGWLADIINDGVRATWNAVSPTADFDGTPLNVITGGGGDTAPQLLYRCVY